MVIMMQPVEARLVVDDNSDEEDTNVDIVTNDDEGSCHTPENPSNTHHGNSSSTRQLINTVSHSSVKPASVGSAFFSAVNLARSDVCVTSVSEPENISVYGSPASLPIPGVSEDRSYCHGPNFSRSSAVYESLFSSYRRFPRDFVRESAFSETSESVARFPQCFPSESNSSGIRDSGSGISCDDPRDSSGTPNLSESASASGRPELDDFCPASSAPAGSLPVATRGQPVPSPTLSVEEVEPASPPSLQSPPDSPVEQCLQHNGTPSDGGIRRYRTAFTKEQINLLEKEFAKENYISRPKRCELAAVMNLPESTIKVWFQNRRMKDKRQRMALAWPYGIPPDPHLYAYIAAAAASFPYQLSAHASAHSSGYLPAGGSHSPVQTLSSLQARADFLTSRPELMMTSHADVLKSRGPELLASHSEMLVRRPEVMSQLSGTAFHKPSPAMLDLRPALTSSPFTPYPLALGFSPLSPVAAFNELSSLGSGALSFGAKACVCPALPGVHSLAAHLSPSLASVMLPQKSEVKLS